ncbi:MAG: hypothetical protein QOD06_1174, partial [Candidatus Binatota bacterium]|nr:hypothetical protein [Candidatus Binatota bacterium]
VAALGSRVRDGIERGAGQFLEAGKAVLGGLGVDLDREIDAATREFSGIAEHDFRQALARRIATPDGSALLGEIQAQVLDRLLVTRLEDLHEDVEKLPWAAVAGLVVPALDHLRRLPFVERTIGEEIDAWLDADGERPVRELLEEAGILDSLREYVLDRGEALARELFATGAFALWVDELLRAGTTSTHGRGSARTTARRRERSSSRRST